MLKIFINNYLVTRLILLNYYYIYYSSIKITNKNKTKFTIKKYGENLFYKINMIKILTSTLAVVAYKLSEI